MSAAEPALVGDCAACDGRMVEVTRADSDDQRTAELVCEECDRTGRLVHELARGGLEDPTEIAGVENPRMVSVSWVRCIRCGGDGEILGCIDDLCHADGRCMHEGNDRCPECHGTGKVPKVVETDGGTLSPAASHGELKRRIATLLGTDPDRYAADLGTERHHRLTDGEISAICERLGLDADASNQTRRDAIMQHLGREHRLGKRLWDSSDLRAVIAALDDQREAVPDGGEPIHDAVEGGFRCDHCGTVRTTPLGMARHRGRCRRGGETDG